MPANVSGWEFVSNSPNVSDPTLRAAHADGRPQVTYTVNFDDLSPVAIKVSQAGATGGLTFYNDPTIINNSGYDFTTFRVSGVSINNTHAQNLPAQEHVVHPRFAHFHDATLAGWSSPTGISYTEFLGFNSSKGVLTNFTPAKGINGADELWMYNGSPVANGTQQNWQDLGMHQFPQAALPTGGQEGGDFYIVYQPNFWPFHDRITPTHHTVYEDTAGTNFYVGSDKNDLAFGYGGADDMQGSAGDDVLVGGTESDHLQGDDGADWLFGGDDNDILNSGAGADMVDGGKGKDAAGFRNETLPVTVSLEEKIQGGFTPVRVNGVTQDLLINVEDIWGGSGNDKITGDENDNHLAGWDGNDALWGRAGKDAFVFDFKPHNKMNKDAIKDFSVVDDTIVLGGAFFNVGSSLSSSEFRVNTTGKAQDKNDKIIYDRDSGVLNYDANGSASGGSTTFATIGKNLKLTSKDFDII